LRIHPIHDFLEERLQFGIGIGSAGVKAKLGDPHRSASRHFVGGLDLLLEVVCSSPLVGIPVNVDEIDVAACAVSHEVAEPCKSHGRATIGDSRGTQKSLASKGFHVLFPGLHSIRHLHARRSSTSQAEIRLVEA